MGHDAEFAMRGEMRRGRRDPIREHTGRNPIADNCPICGKGIRMIAGDIRESMAQHMKAKHPKEPTQSGARVLGLVVQDDCTGGAG